MNCASAESWLLAARTAADLPEGVRGHVAGCDHCRGLQRLVSAIDRQAAGAVRPGDPAARRRLDTILAALPDPRPGVRRASRARSHVLALLFVAVGVVGWLVGWATGRVAPTRPVEPTIPVVAPPDPAPNPPNSFDLRLAHFAAEVTGQDAPAAFAASLTAVAQDIRAEAVRTAEAGRIRDTPRLVAMHDRVVRHGLAGVLARLPSDTRRTVSASVSAALALAGEDLARRADAVAPAVGELLRPLAESCAKGADQIRGAKGPAAPPASEVGGGPDDELIRHSVRFVLAESALAKADASADVSAAVAQLITSVAFDGRPDEASQLGVSLDAIILKGVAGNLDRTLAGQPTAAAREEAAGIRQRSSRATQALERNLAKAPPAARAGLERALNASAKGRESVGHSPDGGKPAQKGPPWKKGDFEHPGKGNAVPPGWQKKSVP